MDDHLEVRHPRHIRGGDDCQGGSVVVVPTQDSPVQERQRAKLPSQVRFMQVNCNSKSYTIFLHMQKWNISRFFGA